MGETRRAAGIAGGSERMARATARRGDGAVGRAACTLQALCDAARSDRVSARATQLGEQTNERQGWTAQPSGPAMSTAKSTAKRLAHRSGRRSRVAQDATRERHRALRLVFPRGGGRQARSDRASREPGTGTLGAASCRGLGAPQRGIGAARPHRRHPGSARARVPVTELHPALEHPRTPPPSIPRKRVTLNERSRIQPSGPCGTHCTGPAS